MYEELKMVISKRVCLCMWHMYIMLYVCDVCTSQPKQKLNQQNIRMAGTTIKQCSTKQIPP